MRILRVNSLCGIKNQLYSPEQSITGNSCASISNGFLDINSLFWSKIFDSQHVQNLIQHAKIELSQMEDPKIQAVLNAPERFFNSYINAIATIDATPGEITPVNLFQAVETLEIVCALHSYLYSTPFVLTLPEGYIHSKYSALDMERTCLLPFCNPYLEFVLQDVIPLILEYRPDVLILTGIPNLPAFSIAKQLRKTMPDVFIVAANHESDYFSLEKIANLLVRNSAFFSVYHCIMLRSDTRIQSKFEQWNNRPTNADLDDIPNLIYSLDGGNTIVRTAEAFVPTLKPTRNKQCRDQVCNIKLFPQNHCYWNHCSFCGINSKYGNICNGEWDVCKALTQIDQLYSCGMTKFWFLDEAIPAVVLNSLAEQLSSRGFNIVWHVRTRIEPAFVDIAKALSLAGLKHIIFGLESASKRILTLMEKTTGGFDYLETAEQIVRAYTGEGIQVHFSVILGFPTETADERHETMLFLTYLQNRYNLFSYNVNSFYLDIGSKIYRRWESYDITSLSFPCAPKYFLENHLDWNNAVSPERGKVIQKDRDYLMMQQYSWYPEGSLIRPNVFFAFWEFGRFSLWWEGLGNRREPVVLDMDKTIAFSPLVCCCRLPSKRWLIYHLKRHHFVIGGDILYDLAKAEKDKSNFSSFLLKYKGPYKAKGEELIFQLHAKGFFV